MADEKNIRQKHYHVGWDHFSPAPGERDSVRCLACGAECEVRRNVTGRRSMYGRDDSVYDSFSCPNTQAEGDWHFQAIKLHEAIAAMPSVTVAKTMRQDLADLLGEHVDAASKAHAMEGADKPYKPSMFR